MSLMINNSIKGLLSRGKVVTALILGCLFFAVPAFATASIDFSAAIPWSSVVTTIGALVLAAVGAAAGLFGGFQGLKAAMSAFVQVVAKSFGR